jgi:hypothetical protein
MSSAASLIAIAVLENPRSIPKSKFIVFDAQIYLGSSEPTLITSLRYFNTDDTVFPEVGCYSVIIQASARHFSLDVVPIENIFLLAGPYFTHH